MNTNITRGMQTLAEIADSCVETNCWLCGAYDLMDKDHAVDVYEDDKILPCGTWAGAARECEKRQLCDCCYYVYVGLLYEMRVTDDPDTDMVPVGRVRCVRDAWEDEGGV